MSSSRPVDTTPLAVGDEPTRLHILLVDHSRLFCEAVRNRLLAEPHIGRVAIATNAAEALRLLSEDSFTAAVAAPELARDMCLSPGRSVSPAQGTPVVVLADSGDTAHARALFRVGVLGWVNRERSIADLMDAVRTCRHGGAYVSADVLAHLTEESTPAEPGDASRQRVLSVLTQREKQVFMLLEQGMGRTEIAAILHLSPNTVRTHIHRILRRLDVHSTLAALALARDAGAKT